VLHNDRDLFEQVITKTSEMFQIAPDIIEKDYFVTLFLKEIVCANPSIIFKGGTSLSKCYHLIDRFSEDIDLNIECDYKPTEGQRKQLKKSIISVIDKFGFTLTNPDSVKSRREYNRYIVDFPTLFGNANYLKQFLIIETAVYIRAYPCNRMTAQSYVYDFLAASGLDDFIKQYDLMPFELNVQTAERTLIDKLYALGDYYLSDAVSGHSRHIYDIYKLTQIVSIDDKMKNLAKEVAEERKNHRNCVSAHEGVEINSLLKEIIDKHIYKPDYNNITSALLFEKVDYNTAIQALIEITDSGLFEK
jgi:predicted nucleotidyltransferase component of viral defense system